MRLSVTRTAKIRPTEIAATISPCVTGKIAQLFSRPYSSNYSLLFPVFFAFAHLALAAAEIAALPAALIFLLAFSAGLAEVAGVVPLIFAHLDF